MGVVGIDSDYKECAACAAKPGSPPLCPACLHNRALVDALRRRIRNDERRHRATDPEGNAVAGLQHREQILFSEKASEGVRRLAYAEILDIVVKAWTKRVKELESYIMDNIGAPE